jgi:phosphatidylserine synthase 2
VIPVNPGQLVRPRTLTALTILLLCLLYVAVSPDIDSTETNVKLGITAAVACFVFIGMLQFRDGPFVRPHVAFWRAVLSLSVLYQMALVFFLFLVSHTFSNDDSVIYYGNTNRETPPYDFAEQGSS